MNQLKNKPWFLLLLVLFFMLHGTVENFGFIYVSAILKVGLTIACGVTIAYFFLKYFLKSSIYTALICFFLCAWVLFFGAIFDLIKSIPSLHWVHSYSFFIPFSSVTFIVLFLFIRRKIKLQTNLCFYLNVLLLTYCVYDSSLLILKSIQTKQKSFSATVHWDPSLVKTKPTIYFILFDEYPGYKSLRDSFAFNNDQLYQSLEAKGFKILPTFSNYNLTFYSMASMLNMEYIDKSYQPLANTMKDDQERINEIKQARAIQYFKSIGYTFTNYSIFEILDEPSINGNAAVITQGKLLTHKIFFNRIISDLGWHFFSGKYKIPFMEEKFMKDDSTNKFIEQKLLELNQQNAAPQFIYAHFNMPHPPIYRDSMGNYLSNAQIGDLRSYTNKQSFLSYLKFANKKIENLANALSTKDPSSIVIIMSDHGYRAYNTTGTAEPLYFDNICAVRLPGNNYLKMKDKWSNVNFFRYLFNCAFNQNILYLSDSTIFLKDKNSSH